ncbi:MAG: elongation factor G [Planctomycetota bacterium]
MAVRDPADIRNIILTGQSGAGKTTLSERLLFETGEISRMGSVEEGNTISDWQESEKAHRHSLYATVMHFEHEKHMVNMIDAPGTPDFIGHTIAAFPAVETVCVLIDAHKGIEPVTRRMMSVAKARKLPRMIIINKIDEEDVDLEGLTEQIQEEFGAKCLPVTLPRADRSGVVPVFDKEVDEPTDFSSEPEAHQAIVEQIVEMQDDLMTQYLEDGGDQNIDKQALHDAFEAALRDAHLVPICYCSAKTGAGIRNLLHVMASLLPNPLEGNPRPFLRTVEGDEVEFHAEPDADAPVLAHVFKIAADKHVGKLGVFRVHQGTIHVKSELILDDQKKPVRIGNLIKRQGKDNEQVEALGPGDVGAVSRIEDLHFDATLHQDHDMDSVHLRPLPLPKPTYGLAIELTNHADETKFVSAVNKIIEGDPCLRIERIAATRQTVLRGLGETHLRLVLERLRDEMGIELNTAPPKVAYKETIRARAEGHYRHKKQTGGSGQFGEVFLCVEPLTNGVAKGQAEDFEFVNATVGGSIPRQFMPAIEKGIRQVLHDGAVAGYPMTGIRVEVYDGKHHAVDSKEVAFVTAGRRAFIDAVGKAQPALLEPFVTVEVTAPAQFMGDLTGDISARRGRVQEMRVLPRDRCVVIAQAPIGELQNYSTDVNRITHGAGAYTVDYSHDEPCPPNLQQEVIAAFEGHADDD